MASVPCTCGQSCMVPGIGPVASGTSGRAMATSASSTSGSPSSTGWTISAVSGSSGEHVA